MSRLTVFLLFFLAVFLQAGAYGLTFLLPDLFDTFNADEKAVGQMLGITAVSTVITVYYSGHLADAFGRLRTLSLACLTIAVALGLYGMSQGVVFLLVAGSVLLGVGWGLTYALAPVALTRLIKPDEGVRYFAMLSIFVMAGFGLSPVMASVMFKSGFAIADAFFLTAGLCTISAMLFWVLITPMRIQALNQAPEAPSRLTLQTVAQIFKSQAWLPVTMVMLGASVFAGLNNFQTVFAAERGLDYAAYFLTYTLTVIALRAFLASFKGGNSPYLIIANLQYIMAFAVLLFIFMGDSVLLYLLVATLFAIGYGASYPILVAMAAADARTDLIPQTLQLFALTYFVGLFGFPLIAGAMITKWGSLHVLWVTAILAIIEASLAMRRALHRRRIKPALY
jgi:MFS family permease